MAYGLSPISDPEERKGSKLNPSWEQGNQTKERDALSSAAAHLTAASSRRVRSCPPHGHRVGFPFRPCVIFNLRVSGEPSTSRFRRTIHFRPSSLKANIVAVTFWVVSSRVRNLLSPSRSPFRVRLLSCSPLCCVVAVAVVTFDDSTSCKFVTPFKPLLKTLVKIKTKLNLLKKTCYHSFRKGVRPDLLCHQRNTTTCNSATTQYAKSLTLPG